MVVTNEMLLRLSLYFYLPMMVGLIYYFVKINAIKRTVTENKDEIVQINSKIDVLKNAMKYLKLDNLIALNSALAKYREGVYEDDHFIQEVGDCKIFKIIDKSNGEITRISYDEIGQISSTQTVLSDTLHYSMEYVNGKLAIGIEYNQNAQKAFCYKYNEIGEVVSRDEYIYNENNGFEIKETIF